MEKRIKLGSVPTMDMFFFYVKKNYFSINGVSYILAILGYMELLRQHLHPGNAHLNDVKH